MTANSRSVLARGWFAALLPVLAILRPAGGSEDHPIDIAFEQAAAAAGSNAEQTEAVKAAWQAWDEELNLNYRLLARSLPPAAAARLQASQRSWIAWRDREIAAIQGIYEQMEGSIWAPAQTYSEMNLTRSRALELARYLELLGEALTGAPASGAPLSGDPAIHVPADSFPLDVRGRRLLVGHSARREAIAAFFEDQVLLEGEEASVDVAERLQYDLPLAEGQAPASLVFDFDDDGVLARLLVGAYQAEQAPPVTALVEWLEGLLGPGEGGPDGPRRWRAVSWEFTFVETLDDEDSAYQVEAIWRHDDTPLPPTTEPPVLRRLTLPPKSSEPAN